MRIPFGDTHHWMRFAAGGNVEIGGYWSLNFYGNHQGSGPAWGTGGDTAYSVKFHGKPIAGSNVILDTVPVFANDAAADAASTLASGGFYKITGSRAVYQKP